jgi:predicted RNase H-related nuclease YkuK (DUF458 family)
MKTKKDLYDYPPVEEWIWRSCDGQDSANVDQFIAKHIGEEFFVGTDSHVYGKTVKFCTALIAWNRGKGACMIYSPQKTPAGKSLRQRLLSEALRSLSFAYYLDARIPSDAVIGIHLDVNENIKYESAEWKEQLVGMIVAQGDRYRASWKPNAWAAMTAADYTT